MVSVEKLGGWTVGAASLCLDSGRWIARANHYDGRTLVCLVPVEAGPEKAEAGVRGLIEVAV